MVGKFVTRFLLGEVLSQLTAIQRPIDVAADVLEEQAIKDRY